MSDNQHFDVMEKSDAEHNERPRAHMAVLALPKAAQAEAGVLLSIEGPGISGLRLAKDTHVR